MSEDGKLSMLIAAEVRKLLFLRDMTMTQLAERAGMTQPYISRRLTGATTLDVDDLQKIADVLHVEIVDLLPRPARRGGGQYNPDSLRVAPRPRRPATGTQCIPPSVPPTSDMPAPAEHANGRRIRRPVVSYKHVTDGAR